MIIIKEAVDVGRDKQSNLWRKNPIVADSVCRSGISDPSGFIVIAVPSLRSRERENVSCVEASKVYSTKTRDDASAIPSSD